VQLSSPVTATNQPPTAVRLRPAVADDQSAIKSLVHEAGINPLGLNWSRFIVAEEAGGLVGCGQLKEHRDGSLELASLAVAGSRRRQGIGRLLLETLIDRADRRLWLMCRSGLVPFYQRFGFRAVPTDERQPPYFARMRKLAHLYHVLVDRGESLAIMTRPPEAG
jgi:N-acetylglutamate synthase-like GNAT family acetyltransferase